MKTKVADVMQWGVVWVNEDAPYKEIVRRMAVTRSSALPVIDRDSRVVGVVSESDVLIKEGLAPEIGANSGRRYRRRAEVAKANGIVARDIMEPPITIGPQESIAQAALIMYESGVLRLPVVDQRGALIGVVAWRDLLRIYLRSDHDLRSEIERDVVTGSMCLAPGSLSVSVRDGVVTIAGQLERRDQIPVLLEGVRNVEGVVDVDPHLSYSRNEVPVAVTRE